MVFGGHGDGDPSIGGTAEEVVQALIENVERGRVLDRRDVIHELQVLVRDVLAADSGDGP
jgi:hypothetical protein